MAQQQPLSIESFSYSWLVNLKPSFESLSDSFRAVLDASDEAFFIEMDPRMPPSKRFLRSNKDDDDDKEDDDEDDLHLPNSSSQPQTPTTVLNSDELFSNSFFPAEEEKLPDPKTTVPTLRRSRSLSKQISEIYLEFLKPLYHKIRWCRSNISKLRSPVVINYSPGTSPRSVGSSAVSHLRSSFDSESTCSISDAVLHCKRTMASSSSSSHAPPAGIH
ncbi:hypothetical protein Dimus_000197 [Dionaea muscipula]